MSRPSRKPVAPLDPETRSAFDALCQNVGPGRIGTAYGIAPLTIRRLRAGTPVTAVVRLAAMAVLTLERQRVARGEAETMGRR